MYLLSVEEVCVPHTEEGQSKLSAWVVSQLYMPARPFGSLHLGAGSIWHDGLGAGQALWHTARSFFLLTSRKSQNRQLRRSVFGRAAWKAWVRTDSTTPQQWAKCRGTKVRVKAFVFIARKRDCHGLSRVCLHEHMCTSSFYVNLEKLILESEEKVRTVKIKNKTTAK